LLSATIGGSLDCENALFINKGSDAFSADGVKVEGDVLLSSGFRAEGAVRLLSATIGGNLDCEGGLFINRRSDAFAFGADGVKVDGDVILNRGFRAEGEVRLLSASIGGNLDCEGALFINKGSDALSMDRVKVEDNVFLCSGFKAEGEVRLVGADIGGDLECQRGNFINSEYDSLSAHNAKVEGNAFLCDGFKAEGKVSLASATIIGDFEWTGISSARQTTLDLRSAKIGTLLDDQESWPEKGKLFLHGLVYDEIHSKAPIDADSRLEWLRLQENFWPQSYEQLAVAFRRGGDDAAARKILIAKNKDKAQLTKLTWRQQLWYRVFGPMIGYGYRPWRVIWIGLGVVLFGWLVFWAGSRAQVMTPTKEGAYASGGNTFCAFVYSLDVFVPLVDLHQASCWLPNANRGGQLQIPEKFSLPVSGRILRYFFWFEIIAGWVLTTLLVVGVTGLVRT